MVRKIVTIGVDKTFFASIFERQRKEIQIKLGITNLSQIDFTKMIKGFKLKAPKQDLSLIKTKRGKRKNESFLF